MYFCLIKTPFIMKKLSLLFFLVFVLASMMQAQVTVKINEFMASNATIISDPYGEYDDWIELYNYGNDTVDIGGFYMTDKLDNPSKHRILAGYEETKIPPKGYLVLWADNDTLQDGPLHLKFKLSASGEAIGLFAPNGITPIDTIVFGQQITDISYGRYPDGNDYWVFFNYPTPGASNSLVNIEENAINKMTLKVFPNPAQGNVISFSHPISFELFNMGGKLISSYQNKNSLNISNLPNGQYLISTIDGEKIKFIVNH